MAPFMAYHRVCSKSNIVGAMCGAGTVALPQHMSSPRVLCGVRVARSVVLCACFADRCLSLPLCCLSFFDLIYGF